MRTFLIALVLLTAASPAHAGTVGASPGDCYKSDCLANLGFAAEPGEENRLSIRVGPAQAVVRDDGAPLTVNSGCRRLSPNEASCDFRPGEQYSRLGVISLGDGDDLLTLDADDWTLSVELGDGDDRFTGGRGIVDGGPGADVLTANGRAADLRGGPGDDRLEGAGDSDTLTGGPGSDEMTGGGGDDVLEPGDGVADRVDGGAGRDRLSYRLAAGPVHVDLADDAPEGAAGEGDRVTTVEDVEGTGGADRLAGDDGPNRLDGSAGADNLTGRGGGDVLVAGGDGDGGPLPSGADRLEAGTGDDLLVPGAGETSAICGTGEDTVRLTDGAAIRFGVTCERALLRTGSGVGRLRFRPGGVLEVPCPAGEARPGPRCVVRATVIDMRAVERRAVIRRGGVARLRFGRRWRCRVLLELRIEDTGRAPVRTSLTVTPPGGARC